MADLECKRCHQKTKRLFDGLCVECVEKEQALTKFLKEDAEKTPIDETAHTFQGEIIRGLQKLAKSNLNKYTLANDSTEADKPTTIEFPAFTIDYGHDAIKDHQALKMYVINRTKNNSHYDTVLIMKTSTIANDTMYLVLTATDGFFVNKERLKVLLEKLHKEFPFLVEPDIFINFILDDDDDDEDDDEDEE